MTPNLRDFSWAVSSNNEKGLTTQHQGDREEQITCSLFLPDLSAEDLEFEWKIPAVEVKGRVSVEHKVDLLP